MNHDRTYRPVPYAPALRLRDADNSIRPHTYGVRVCSCTSIATEPCRPTACAGEYPCCTFTHPATAHYSLLIANSSYTFSAKEKDPETGLSYFGSRYYSSDLSIWLSVDPMSDKYPSLSPFVYCADNPVKVVDPNGEEIDDNLDKWKYNKTTRKLDWISNEGGKYHQIVVETENTPSGEKVNRTVEFDGAIGMMFKFSVFTPTVDGIISGVLDMVGGGSTVMAGAAIGVGGGAVTGGATVPVGAAILGAGAYQMCSGLITVMDALFGSEADMYEQQDFVRDVCKSTGNSLFDALSLSKNSTTKDVVKTLRKNVCSFLISTYWSYKIRNAVTHPEKREDFPQNMKIH